MTNKEDDDEQYDPDKIPLLAVHLVNQVLDEAYAIANTARESGQSWRYLTMLKHLKSCAMVKTTEDIFITSKGDSNVNENKIDVVANVIATSTPQKLSDGKKIKIESAYIGQGDEELEIELDELTSTSMFIHDLFDMSETMISDDSEIMPHNDEPKYFSTIESQDMSKSFDSPVNTTTLCGTLEYDIQPINVSTENVSESTEHSDFSFLADANFNESFKGKVEGESSCSTENYYKQTSNNSKRNLKGCMDEIKQEDTSLNENVYLTLNRDYEQYSEEEADPVIQNPKGLILQEIELLTANTSDDNVSPMKETEQIKKSQELMTATVSSADGSRKIGLVRRCRSQGARLLSCMRGWWRFKSNKRKEGSHLCPLSPEARRRASSSLDQRLLRSPNYSSSVSWKFNTINEATASSRCWKDFAFDNETEGYDEY